MMNNLREEGFDIGRDRTRRLMKALQLKVKQKRKYKVTTDSKHKLPVARNVLTGISRHRHRTEPGARISRTSGLKRVGSIWPWSLIFIPAAWWVGRSIGA